MVLFNVLLFIAGLILLAKGADFFIKSSAKLAKRFGVSEFIIGLTLVAVGTSIPELASSIFASLKKDSGLIIGNVLGSNIANIGLVLGISTIIAAKKTNRTGFKRDGYIMLFSSFVFYFLALSGMISRAEAAVLLLIYVTYILFILQSKVDPEVSSDFKGFMRYFYKFEYLTTVKSKLLNRGKNKKVSYSQKKKITESIKDGIIVDILIIIIAGAAIIYGASLLVNQSIFFAKLFNLPTTIIGLIFVAIGTSVPELGVSIAAARKGHSEMAIGNIIGSNIANILLIIGISGLISPLVISKSTLYFLAPFMLFISILLLFFMRSNWKLRKIEGVILLIIYIIFVILSFTELSFLGI